jgi:hypothetical protein
VGRCFYNDAVRSMHVGHEEVFERRLDGSDPEQIAGFMRDSHQLHGREPSAAWDRTHARKP